MVYSVLWALRGAEAKSVVCPAQKWPKIKKSKMVADTEVKYIYVHIFLTEKGKNFNDEVL